MKFLWCDTETTGIKPENASPFQAAFIFCYSAKVNGEMKQEVFDRVFLFNPLDIPGIEYSEEADAAVARMAQHLEEFLSYKDGEKMFFCGYNAGFDWNHLACLFKRFGCDFSKYFHPQKLDVFEQVKKAGQMGKLPYLENRKLSTVASHLKIKMDNAHDALCDIRATREVAKSLAKMGVPLK